MGINKIKKCYNCGAILQSDDKGLVGYCAKDILENERQNFIFCDSCFSKEKYQNNPNEPIIDNETIKLLKDAKKRRAIFIYVVSLNSFECSFSRKISELLVGCNVVALGNKKDLLPKEMSDSQVTDYLRHRFSVAGIQLRGFFITTGDSDENFSAVSNLIAKYRHNKDVVIIGSAGSGKKTLALQYLKFYKNNSDTNVVTDKYPGTNVNCLTIPLGNNAFIYSVPGWGINNSYLDTQDNALRRAISVNKRITKKETSISKGQSLMIGGLAVIELVAGPKTNLELYFNSNFDYYKRPSNIAIDRFTKWIKDGTIKPANKSITSLKDLDVYEIKVSEINKRDIGIEGLGWLSFEGKQQTFRIYVPHNVAIYKSRAKI